MSRVVNITVNGMDRVQAAIRAFGADVQEQIAKAIEATATEALDEVRRSIKHGPKSGHVYYRIPGDKYMTIRQGSVDGPIVAVFRAQGKQNLSLTHRASAPGQAPASDTGTLVNSTYYTKVDPFTVAIGSRLEYAFILEFGSKGGKIAKRPAWIPAAEKAAPRLQKRILRVIQEATARAQKGTA